MGPGILRAMEKDIKNTALWIIGSEISFMIEQTNKYPSVSEVRQYPSVAIHCNEIEDNEIIRIINNIRKIDEREFLARHNYLRENKSNYIGFRAISVNEKGDAEMKFVCNDSLCKRLAERLLNS